MLCYPTILPFLLVLVGALGLPKTYYDQAKAQQHFANFIKKYNKTYNSAEEHNMRFEIFKKKLTLINHWNNIHEPSFDINQFADESPSRLKSGFVPSKLRMEARNLTLTKKLLRKLPASLDYRSLGLVTEVKDQKHCNSCYIFGAVGNIEGQYAKRTGELLSLSEQDALNCVGNPCSEGGDHYVVIRDLSDRDDGLMSEEDLPYNGTQQQCLTDENKVKVKVISAISVVIPDEEALKAALVKYGPLAIGIYASSSIRAYDGRAVMKPFDCYDEDADHSVLLVGYSKDENGTPYWIIKNSWGTNWGHQGYLHLEMGKEHCSILQHGAVTSEVIPVIHPHPER